MAKVIILSDGFNIDNVNLSKNDDIIILGQKTSTIPLFSFLFYEPFL